MSNVKISGLPTKSSLGSGDYMPIVDVTAGETKKITGSTLADFLATSTNGWNNLIDTYAYGANNGSKEFTVTANNDLRTTLSPGMRMGFTRGTTPPTQCMAFASGSSQYATKSSPTGITFTSAFTCEAWIYLLSYTGQAQEIIARLDRAYTSGGWEFGLNSNGQLLLQYGSGSNFTNFQTYQSVPLNQWVHVAGVVTSTSSKTGAIYINGTSVNVSSPSTSATSLTQASVDLRLGAGSATPSNTYFNGYMSEVRVWSVAQSAASIQANMGINLSSQTNLVALFQGSASFADTSGNSNNLTATNGASDTQTANPYNTVEYGVIRSVTYSSPTSTVTLFTDAYGVIPNETLTTPQYSVAKEPQGWPANLISDKIWGTILWCANVTTTATGSGTQMNGATMTVTVPTNGKRFIIKAGASNFYSSAGTPVMVAISGGNGVYFTQGQGTIGIGLAMTSEPFMANSGSQTFALDMYQTSAGTCTLQGQTSAPSWFILEEA